jgi:hypothetical protein
MVLIWSLGAWEPGMVLDGIGDLEHDQMGWKMENARSFAFLD